MTGPAAQTPDIRIRAPSPGELDQVRVIFQEYAASLAVDLAFQNFEYESAHLPGAYAAPGGALLTAHVNHQLAGCCALRPLEAGDYPNACEMKRLYVRPGFRGLGLGRRLVEAALDAARGAGYRLMLLDTLDDMGSARALYKAMGFEEVAPYYRSPIAGSHYLKAEL
jgi:ribosomal protein S18 acetylase RimI-like enzyme